MFVAMKEAGVEQVRIAHQFLQRPHGAVGNLDFVEKLAPFRRGAQRQLFGDDPVQFVIAVHAFARFCEPLILGELGPAEYWKQSAPLIVAHGKHADVAVLRFVGATVRRQQTHIAHAVTHRRIECCAPQVIRDS